MHGMDLAHSNFFQITLRGMSHIIFDDNIGSGNGLEPSGTKPLPEPMLIQIYVIIWCH